MIERLKLQIATYRAIAKEHKDLHVRVIYKVVANELERILNAADTNE